MQTDELIPPDRVLTVRDLPARFLLGDLEPGSFRRDREGWQARYVDRMPGTWVRVRHVTGGPFLAFPRWHNLPGTSVIDPGNSWVELARRFCENGVPGSWQRTARARIEATWSLGFRSGAAGLPAPEDPLDGPEYVILFPARFREDGLYIEVRRLEAGIERSGRMGAPVRVTYTRLYRQEQAVTAPPVVADREEHRPMVPPFYLHAWPGVELPDLPAYDPDPPRGSLRWLPRLREHPMIVVHCRFRDLERVLDLLAGEALLPPAVSRLMTQRRDTVTLRRYLAIPPARLHGFVLPAPEYGGELEFVHIDGPKSMRVRYTPQQPKGFA